MQEKLEKELELVNSIKEPSIKYISLRGRVGSKGKVEIIKFCNSEFQPKVDLFYFKK